MSCFLAISEVALHWGFIEDKYAQHGSGLPEGPRILLKKMIAEGCLGVKSGRGFYNRQ